MNNLIKKIVETQYDDINDLIADLGLLQINDALIQQAERFDGSSERNKDQIDNQRDSIVTDHMRAEGYTTYIETDCYDDKRSLPEYDADTDNAYHKVKKNEAYNQCEHSKPFCQTISLVNAIQSESQPLPADMGLPKPLLYNPESQSFTRIFKKIGDGYYYISVESELKLVAEGGVVPFTIFGIYEMDNSLVRNGLFVTKSQVEKERPQAYKEYLEKYIDDILQESKKNKVKNDDAEKYQKLLREISIKKTDGTLEKQIDEFIDRFKFEPNSLSSQDLKILETVVSRVTDIIETDAGRAFEHYQFIESLIEENEKFNGLLLSIEAITKGKLIASINDVRGKLILDDLQKYSTKDLDKLNRILKNISIFERMNNDFVSTGRLPTNIFEICNNYSISSQDAKIYFGLEGNGLPDSAWEMVDDQYNKSLALLESDVQKKIKLTGADAEVHRKKCILLQFFVKKKYLSDNKSGHTKADLKEFLKLTLDVSTEFPQLKEYVNAVKAELFPDLEKDKKQQQALAKATDAIQISVKNLQTLGYVRINDSEQIIRENLKGSVGKTKRNPDHVKPPRATKIWVNGKQVTEHQDKYKKILRKVITFDYTVGFNNKGANDLTKLTAEFDCIFDENEATENFIIIEKNLQVKDNAIDPMDPMISHVPFQVLGVYNKKNGALIGRYVLKDHAVLANAMHDDLQNSVDKLPLDVCAHAPETYVGNNKIPIVEFKKTPRILCYDKIQEIKGNPFLENLKINFDGIKRTYFSNDNYTYLITIVDKISTQIDQDGTIPEVENNFKIIVDDLKKRANGNTDSIHGITVDYANEVEASFDAILKILIYRTSLKDLVKKVNPNPVLSKLKDVLEEFNPTNKNEYELLTRVITQSIALVENNRQSDDYLKLIEEVDNKMDGRYKNDDLINSMFGIFVLATIACICFLIPPVAGALGIAAGVSYFVEGALVAGIISFTLGGSIKSSSNLRSQHRYSPLYDAMQAVNKHVQNDLLSQVDSASDIQRTFMNWSLTQN
jgi:hypothetical protein